MTPTKRNETDLDHRRTHAGQHYLCSKLIHSDHRHRALSLLHLMLNSVSSTLTVTVSAGATKAHRKTINETLEANQHQWRLKETKSVFEKKPAGNECRHFLWRPGNVLLKVLRARYNVTETSTDAAELEAAVSRAQADGARYGQDVNQRLNAAPRPAPPPSKTQNQKRAKVQILSALGKPRHPSMPLQHPPKPPAPAAPSATPATVSRAAMVASATPNDEEETITL